MKKFFQEFKKFIAKGNIVDMAVGLIIATAFNKIVSSLVNDILMPLFTFAIGAESLADLTLVIHGKRATLTWHYGLFLQTILNFLIIAFSLFLMVKMIANSQKKLKEFNSKLLELTKKERREKMKAIKKQAKQENRPFKELLAELQQKEDLEKEEQTLNLPKAVEIEQPKPECIEDNSIQTLQIELLQEIRDILKEQKNESIEQEKKEL